MRDVPPVKVCVVGSGTHFLSGISYYTHHLAVALAERVPVCVILMRRLIPRALYPGRVRVGEQIADLIYPAHAPVMDGIDWFWLPSIARAIRFLFRERPTHVLFQWWTGAVLHSFLALAVTARVFGARIIVEFHEVQDPGESGFLVARLYVRVFARAFMRAADGFVVHSEFDRDQVRRHYKLGQRPVQTIPHGPYDHHEVSGAPALRVAPEQALNFLFFGTIRPYKGLEDLIEAFNIVCDAQSGSYWLTVVGETWERWTLPSDLIARSQHRDRITFVNKYVVDDDVARWFAGADAVVLPYRRSSASGPLHLSMSAGLPTVVTTVGGLPEAAREYQGAVFAEPANPAALAGALLDVARLCGQHFADPHSWDRSAELTLSLVDRLQPRGNTE